MPRPNGFRPLSRVALLLLSGVLGVEMKTLPVKHKRAHTPESGPPSTGAAIAMDGGVWRCCCCSTQRAWSRTPRRCERVSSDQRAHRTRPPSMRHASLSTTRNTDCDTQGTDQPLPHETLPRSGRVTRWTNTPVRIFKDPAPRPPPDAQPRTYSIGLAGSSHDWPPCPRAATTCPPCPTLGEREEHTDRCENVSPETTY